MTKLSAGMTGKGELCGLGGQMGESSGGRPGGGPAWGGGGGGGGSNEEAWGEGGQVARVGGTCAASQKGWFPPL